MRSGSLSRLNQLNQLNELNGRRMRAPADSTDFTSHSFNQQP